MVLLGDEAHVEARFGPFGDSANLDVDSNGDGDLDLSSGRGNYCCGIE